MLTAKSLRPSMDEIMQAKKRCPKPAMAHSYGELNLIQAKKPELFQNLVELLPIPKIAWGP